MNIRHSMQCLLIAVITFAGVLWPRAARADDGDFGLSTTLSDGPYFPPNRWVPVRVQAINRSQSAVSGKIVFTFVGQNETAAFRLPLTVAARSHASLNAYVYIPLPPDPPRRKDVARPPICFADWVNDAGERIYHASVLGQAVEDEGDGPVGRVRIDRPFVMSIASLFDAPSPLPESAVDNSVFVELFQSTQGTKIIFTGGDVGEAPRDLLGYDSTGVVVLDGSAIERLDPAQQRALLDYMAEGGTILLADPLGATDLSATWLGPYLPARAIGSHFADHITIGIGEKAVNHKLVTPLEITEWTADPAIAGAQIIASDSHYVHAAYKSVGLGRLIVTSFPPNAFDAKNAATRRLWSSLFPASPRLRLEDSQLSGEQREFLGSMVGLKVPPWKLAAAVAAGYVLIVLAIQLAARQGRRPTGFAVTVAASLLIAGGLGLFAMFRDKSVALSIARIDVIDLDHGGLRTETASLLGPVNESLSLSAVPGASLRPVTTVGSKSSDIQIAPLLADKTGVSPSRLDYVWQSRAAVPATVSLLARGRFDERGVALTIDNRVGPITGAVLVGSGGRFTLPNLPLGETSARADDSGLALPSLQLDLEHLRGEILDAAMTPASIGRMLNVLHADDAVSLAGWLSDPLPPLMRLPADAPPAVSHDNSLVRSHLEIEPSPVGSKVHISKAFTQMLNTEMTAIPYVADKRQWTDSYISVDFVVGFAFPTAIGKVRTTQATIDLQANAPQQTVTIRRGQVESGNVRSEAGGPVIAAWDKLIGAKSVTFDISPGDVDVNGWLWLRVSVDGPRENEARWRFQDLSVSYEGVIDGPPQAAVMPAREAPAPFQPTPPAKRSAVKKPATPKPPKTATTKSTSKKKDTP